MPLPVDSLTRSSTPESISAAISSSVSQCMDEGGREQNQCVAIALSVARRKTGRSLGQGGTRTRQALAAEDGQ